MRVAIVHDWLVNFAGAERVLEQILLLYPEADLYCLFDVLPEQERAFLRGKPVHTSFIQKLPKLRKWYRRYLPLMPMAVEQFDMSAYDLIISSSHTAAKGVLTEAGQLHLSYVHTPVRYAWDQQHQYQEEVKKTRGVKSWTAKALMHYLRLWDLRTVNGVDGFIANSRFIARRIRKAYHRDADVIYPPVAIESFRPGGEKEDFYLTASRMVSYKKIDLIAAAFRQMPDKKLIIIGDGPEYDKIRSEAGDAANILFLGYQPSEVLIDYMRRARAFVFAAEEDFGITPLEAQACGTPVIAYRKGGVLETVQGLNNLFPTGVFFEEQTVSSLQKGIELFEAEGERITPQMCRDNAMRFSPERFRKKLHDYILRMEQNYS